MNGDSSLLQEIQRTFPPLETDVRRYSPLALAFLGDGVYSLIVRTIVVERGNRPAQRLHNETKELVSAHAQARIGDAIRELLTEEEALILRRGHNANPEHHPRNASMEEYRKATALEALCGYLYLQNEMGRLLYLLREGMDRTEPAGKGE